MTNDTILWTTLRRYLPRKTWVSIDDIFGIIRRQISLDTEDITCAGARSKIPRWESNVRRILHSKQRDGRITGRGSPTAE